MLLLKPELDVRFGKDQIKSRAGLEMSADVLIRDDTDLYLLDFEGVDCILVDEVQFMPPNIIEQLRSISIEKGFPFSAMA